MKWFPVRQEVPQRDRQQYDRDKKRGINVEIRKKYIMVEETGEKKKEKKRANEYSIPIYILYVACARMYIT